MAAVSDGRIVSRWLLAQRRRRGRIEPAAAVKRLCAKTRCVQNLPEEYQLIKVATNPQIAIKPSHSGRIYVYCYTCFDDES